MSQLNLRRKLAILSDAAKYDASCASAGAPKRGSAGGRGVGSSDGSGICHAYAPDGRCISLLKILLTNYCVYDCAYCVNRVSSNQPRARFTAEEVVDLTLGFYKRNYIEGLFLSSGIIRDEDYTLGEMVRAARMLRQDHDFRGYIHLKLIPNAAPDLVLEAGLYADRVSINVELPGEASLKALAPEKDLVVIRKAMGGVRLKIDERKAAKSRRAAAPPAYAPAGQSTQIIVGADQASDGEILGQSERLYGAYGLRRVYYSAFSPIPDSASRLPLKSPPLWREHRLYQADWLMRYYGFARAEIVGDADNLALDVDPKTAWALAHRDQFPVDVNAADREMLLRTPGLGVKSVQRILAMRRVTRLTLADVRRIARGLKVVQPFIVAADWSPGRPDRRRESARRGRGPATPTVLMREVCLRGETDVAGWRAAARRLRLAEVAPEAVRWRVTDARGDLFESEPATAAGAPNAAFAAPRAFLNLASDAILHRDPRRFDLLYRVLWRLKDTPSLLSLAGDADVAALGDLVKGVWRASHKMKAFVRFRQVTGAAEETFVAWFEPAHRVVEKTAPFFAERFANQTFSILTPEICAHWDRRALTFGPGAHRGAAPADDDLEAFWRTYYASIFNPARLNPAAMRREMPKRYWRNLPEAALIPGLIRDAETRAAAMVASPATVSRRLAPRPRAVEAPPAGSLAEIAAGAAACRRCDLWRDATQAVSAEGPAQARLMLVGEQPGDQEDLAGRPFVGPAGQVLDDALRQAGLDRGQLLVTNAVRHFKHEPRGKRRLHKTPTTGEVEACRWWLDAERARVRPKVIVALGATAALAVAGRPVRLSEQRGRPIPLADESRLLATYHPSYVLRLPDARAKAAALAALIDDLKLAAQLAGEG